MLKEADFLKAASLFTASSPSYNGFLMAGKRRVELCEVPVSKTGERYTYVEQNQMGCMHPIRKHLKNTISMNSLRKMNDPGFPNGWYILIV